ncbi:MAG: hypothetical protein P4L28_11905 [Paludibacteraceae bacterium]|nr:hypothetical protein [Paludibacteraceae bacterium]
MQKTTPITLPTNSSETLQTSPPPTWVGEIRQRYGNDLSFLQTFNPSLQAPYITQSLARCFIGSAPSLARVQATYGFGTTITWLSAQLVDLALFSGIKEKPNLEQITAIAETILVSYSHLKVTELMVFFQKFKAGEYGRFYGVIDGLVITDALNNFLPYRKQMIDRFEKEKADREQAEKRERSDQNTLTHEEYELLRWYYNM